MNPNPWISILSKLKLSRAEQAALKRFEHDPEGRGFLPVADILRVHKKIEESLELLTQGVERHPSFTVARVVLARELLARGMVAAAADTLEASSFNLDDNVLAQKLLFKIALLKSNFTAARQLHKHLKTHRMHDEETEMLGSMLDDSRDVPAHEYLVKSMRATGIEVVLPEREDHLPPPVVPPLPKTKPSSALATTLQSEESEERLQNFHVVPLNEIFRGSIDEGFAVPEVHGVELDSTTLADLYCKQGHYSKAVAIFRRLLRITPHNEYLRKRLAEVLLQEKQQKIEDLSVDPAIVDQMEALEIVNVQSDFLKQLLTRLDERERL